MPTDPKKPTDDGRAKGSSDFLPVKSDRGSTMGEILLREKLVNVKQLEEAQRVQGGGENLTHTLAKLGYLEESQLINFLSRQYGVPSINLDEVEITEDVVEEFGVEAIREAVQFPDDLVMRFSTGTRLDDAEELQRLGRLAQAQTADAKLRCQGGFRRQAVTRPPLLQQNPLVEDLVELMVQGQPGVAIDLIHQADTPRG